MLRDITIGQYYPIDSVVHRMDPRLKIGVTFAFLMSLFIVAKMTSYLVVVAFIGICLQYSKVPFKYVTKGLKPILMILFFAFFINIFFTEGNALVTFYGATITVEGLYQAFFMMFRLLLLIIGTSLLTLTTSPIELTDGLERMLMPFKRYGLPAHELAMMMTIALRFIPVLLEETDKIMKAQMARGADFESGNLMKRAHNLIPLLVPLFVSAFRRADELAMAMEARCYRGGDNRTRLKVLKYGKSDAFGLSVIVCYLIILFAVDSISIF